MSLVLQFNFKNLSPPIANPTKNFTSLAIMVFATPSDFVSIPPTTPFQK